MVEEAMDFRGARRMSQSSHSGARRFSRDNISPIEGQGPFQVSPPSVAGTPAQPQQGAPAYVGYATRDVSSGHFNTFEPAHPAYKTTQGKQEVLEALRSSEGSVTSHSRPLTGRPLPVVQEQPASAPVAIQQLQPSGQQLTTMHNSEMQNEGRPSFTNRANETPRSKRPGDGERDFFKLWISAPSITEAFVSEISKKVPQVIDVSRVRSRIPGHFNPRSKPQMNYAFMEYTRLPNY